MNATCWKVVDGQHPATEVVSTGHHNARAAWNALSALTKIGGTGRVACLKTIEHELPRDDPAHQPFESSRYCVVVPKGGDA